MPAVRNRFEKGDCAAPSQSTLRSPKLHRISHVIKLTSMMNSANRGQKQKEQRQTQNGTGRQEQATGAKTPEDRKQKENQRFKYWIYDS